MKDILKEIDNVRLKLKKGPADTLLMKKPFAQGMYRFSMFMINYYARVREELKLDYDSFIIIQTVVSHVLYHLNKNKYQSSSYDELEIEWEKLIYKKEKATDTIADYTSDREHYKLTISSVCLVAKLPKETVRRKINELVNKNLLKISKKNGVLLGAQYKKIFREFVPQTTLEISKLIKLWEKTGILKNILNFKV